MQEEKQKCQGPDENNKIHSSVLGKPTCPNYSQQGFDDFATFATLDLIVYNSTFTKGSEHFDNVWGKYTQPNQSLS